ncbi:prolactin isoform X2 [Acipenser ruthenus]|uniref:prolactin isoform X2 n=1 Tax=Acipenser ruthenus TaxID=7906 RepID=UPI00274033F7|nr:prolactin isoform X2 [Acipenser ruthenus]
MVRQRERKQASFTMTLAVVLCLCPPPMAPSPLCGGLGCPPPILLSDLLERATQLSQRLHSLSRTVTAGLDPHFSPLLKPRPSSLCHTSSLATPEHKEQALTLQEELLSLIMSLLRSWTPPLMFLVREAQSLPPPHSLSGSLSWQTAELSQQSQKLAKGLETILNRFDPSAAHKASFGNADDLWKGGASDFPGSDRKSRLLNFYFLLSCFRRDSHKIDSFLKLLRCRALENGAESC